ncbi:mitochondrial carrier domain-containing protein, partial [Tribonema minus]
ARSSLSVARHIIQCRGAAGLYDGVEYSVLEGALEKAAYFYGYGWLRRAAVAARGGRPPGALADVALGYAADACHLPLTLPLQLVLARLITARGGSGGAGADGIVRGILKTQGWRGLYRGARAYVVLCLKPALQYAIFNRLRGAVLAAAAARRRGGGSGSGGAAAPAATTLSAAQAFALGAIARAIATVAVFPFTRAKVLAMTDDGGHSESGKPPPSILQSLVLIARTEGPRALFKGVGPELTRGVLSAALMLMIKERSGALSLQLLRSLSGHRPPP